MSPVQVNGRRLGVERNGVFSQTDTAVIAGGRLWLEAARAWNDMRAAAIDAGLDPNGFAPNGPQSSARSIAAQQYFWAHRPPPAAFPGTSNHGWGLAVDVRTRPAAAWILAHGHRYGWSWDEGRRVGEWWHFRYVGGYRPRPVALPFLTRDERRWATEYDRLRAQDRDLDRRRVLRRVMRRRRREIWAAAQHSGWDTANRRRRYRSLLARTT